MSVPSPKGHPRCEATKRGAFRSEEVSVARTGSSKPGYNKKRDDAADGLYWAC